MQITADQLHDLCPRPSDGARAEIWDGYVAAMLEAGALLHQFEINTPLRWAHLVATWAHETGGFTIMWESGAYSAKRIMQIFGVGKHSAAVTQAEANRLAGNAYATFERVYGVGDPKCCRKFDACTLRRPDGSLRTCKARELGNRAPGDGYACRGLGIQQLTGKADQERYAAEVGCKREELCDPYNSMAAALLEWRAKGCNALADRGWGDDAAEAVCRKINGGVNGLPHRKALLAEARRIWAGPKTVVTSAPAGWNKPAVQKVDVGPLQPPQIAPVSPGTALEAPPSSVFEPLRLASRGQAVLALQRALAASGYCSSLADGKFGSLTQRDLCAWQLQHGYPATGVLDTPEQWHVLLSGQTAVQAVPGRQALGIADLQERAPAATAGAVRAKSAGSILATIATALGLDMLTGTGSLEGIIGLIEKLAEMSGRLSGVSVTGKGLVVLLMLGGGVYLYRGGAASLTAMLAALRKGGTANA